MPRTLPYKDDEGGMAKAQLLKIETYAKKLNEMIHPDDELEAWVQSKLSVVAAYMGDIKHYLDYELNKFENGGNVDGMKKYEVEFSWESESDDDWEGRKVKVYANSIEEASRIVTDKFGKYYKGFQIVEVELDKDEDFDVVKDGNKVGSVKARNLEEAARKASEWYGKDYEVKEEEEDDDDDDEDKFSNGGDIDYDRVISLYESYLKNGEEYMRLLAQSVYSKEKEDAFIERAKKATFKKFDDGRYDYKQEVFVHNKGVKTPYLDKYKVFSDGGSVRVPVDTKISQEEVDKFTEYVYRYYGKNGIYADQLNGGFNKTKIRKAVNQYLENLDKAETWGGGDSLDRENVRLILQPDYALFSNGGIAIREEGSTLTEDMKEAEEWIGKDKWNMLSTEDKIETTKMLKYRGYIGYPAWEEDIETVSAMQYNKGGGIEKEWIAVYQKKNNQIVITVNGKSKEEAYRNAEMSKASNGLVNWDMIDLYVNDEERVMKLGESVNYKGDLYEITQKGGVTHLTRHGEGAWGSDYPTIPLSQINQSELRDMYGNKVFIPYTFAVPKDI
jgi:hypothetical protein